MQNKFSSNQEEALCILKQCEFHQNKDSRGKTESHNTRIVSLQIRRNNAIPCLRTSQCFVNSRDTRTPHKFKTQHTSLTISTYF